MKTRTNTDALERWYAGADVPMSMIGRYTHAIAERFQREKIILFGSYPYGTPHAGSDVDILVIMSARDELAQSLKVETVSEVTDKSVLHRLRLTRGNDDADEACDWPS